MIIVIIFFIFFSLQGLPIQLRRPLNLKAIITYLDGKGCRPQNHGVAARRADLPLAPKVGQTPHQVSVCQGLGQPQRQVAAAWGASRQAWPSQRLGLTAQTSGVRNPMSVPPARHLGPAPSSCSHQIVQFTVKLMVYSNSHYSKTLTPFISS